MNPLERIQSYYADLTKTDLEIADYILKNPVDAARSSIDHLAKSAHVSKSAAVRFSNRIGYSGYAEFKYDLARYLTSQNSSTDPSISDPVQAITANYSRYILQIAECVTRDDLIRIAEFIKNARLVKIFGQNRTFNSAMQLRTRLAKIGIDAEAVQDESLTGDLSSILSKNDCAIIFTIQDNTGLYRVLSKRLSENHCPIICFTMSQALSFRNKCDELIVLPRISRDSAISFLDDQAIYFVFIELLMDALASVLQK